MSEINIIKIEGIPLEKLVEVVSKAIGTLYRPRSIRREAEAEAYKIEIIERAKAKANAEGNEIEAETFLRIQERLIHREKSKQLNIDNVTQIAADQLGGEASVSEEPVDEDWSTRFFNIVEDISNEEMQALWGRILAGEVKQPGSFSVRTLELLKNLSKIEAEVFTKFAKFALQSGDSYFVFDPDNGEFLESEFGINFVDKLLLDEVGLITSKDNLTINFRPTGDKEQTLVIYYGQKGFFLKRQSQTPNQSIGVVLFSKPGIELLKLIESNVNDNYIKKFATKLKSDKTSLKFGDIKPAGPGQVTMVNAMDL